MGSIAELVDTHPELLAKLRRFSFVETAQLAGSLLLNPTFHANTLRLEAFLHLAAIGCKGEVSPQRNDVADWLGRIMNDSPLARLEDPVEDVFVGCVNTSSGSFRVFRGILENGDFWTERVLLSLEGKCSFEPIGKIVSAVTSLLRLCDALAERANLRRYAAGYGQGFSRIVVPRWRDMEMSVQALRFNFEDLQGLGIDSGELKEFCFDPQSSEILLMEHLWNSTLERRPLVVVEDGIVLFAPSTVVRSALRFMIEKLAACGILNVAETFYAIENATLFVNEIGSRLDIDWLNLSPPEAVPGVPPVFPAFGRFDHDKYVVAISLGMEMGPAATEFHGYDELSPETSAGLDKYLKNCAAILETCEGFAGGLILVSMAGVGRAMLHVHSPLDARWRWLAAPLPDWLTMINSGECTAIRLWKLTDHQAALRRHSIDMMNLSGLPNLFAFWLKNDFRMVPLEMDISHTANFLNVGCNFTKAFRERVKQSNDIHSVLSHDGDSWVRVSRMNVRPIFQDDAQSLLYAELPGRGTSELKGCFQGSARIWWVAVAREDVSLTLRDLLFRLWECVLNWLERAAPVIEHHFTNLPDRSIEIRLALPDFPNWNSEKTRAGLSSDSSLSVSIEGKKRRVLLTIPEGFVSQFNQPQNIAERDLIGAMIDGTAMLSSTALGFPLRGEMIDRIAGNHDARYFHVIESHDLQQMLGGSGWPKPVFIADEDRAISALGLAQFICTPPESRIIFGLEETRTFLQDGVTKVWERVEERLKAFDRQQVIIAAFDALDEIGRDAQHWRMTARSVFALHEDRTEVHQVTHERRGLRGEANLANRILIETAQYACLPNSPKLFNQADHLSLLADISLLLNLAQHRDAIAFGYIEPSIKIHPNGELDLDMEFYNGTLAHFFSRRSADVTEAASADYDRYFEISQEKSDQSLGAEKRIADLEPLFLAEYGFGINQCLRVLDELTLRSREEGNANFRIDDRSMRILLEERCGFSTQEAKRFVEVFTLPIRTAWDKDLPALCRKEDVYPWRFRRQMSLLSKPFLELSKSPGTWVVSATFFEDSLAYFLGNIDSANFPQHNFRSEEMRRHWGAIVHKRGHEFSKQVEKVFGDTQFLTELEVEMTSIGAAKQGGFGDLDVVAWRPDSGVVYLVECKKLQPVNSVREVIQRLEDFQGDEKSKDSLGRHLRRVNWTQANLSGLAELTNIPSSKIVIRSLLVTSETVPMQFYKNIKFPPSQVVPIDLLGGYLSRPENR